MSFSFSYSTGISLLLECLFAGAFGGMQAAMHLRSLLGELGALSVSNMFGIPMVQDSLDPDGNPTNDRMIPGAKRLITQLDWHARAMKNHRDSHGVPA